MEEKDHHKNQHLVIAINGERFEVPSIHPSTTLIEFLRTRTRFKSVKLGCGEGGCGSCTVMVSKYNTHHNKVENYTVNSCLTLLCSLNGCSITTSEGIGNSRSGFHPIQKTFAGFHASQCGFCTPGMCMSLFSAVTNSDKLTVSEAEKSTLGNLCRCTGYRPIADACKSFAYNVDIEDLGLNSFWRKEDNKEDKASSLPSNVPNDQICKFFPEFLKEELELNSKGCSWYSPTSIKDLQSKLEVIEYDRKNRVKLVVSNTGSGYYKEVEKYDVYIDLRYIPELSVVRKDEDCIHIGAAITISRVIATLKECKGLMLSKIATHLEKVASKSIRNSASIGGNLVMAQRNCFPSDIATLMLAVNSTVELVIGLQREIVTFEEFLAKPPLDDKALLLSVNIPIWKPVLGRNSKLLFETYRASPRPLGNALPYLNAAFLAEVSPNKDFGGVVINSICLALGAYGNVHSVRAKTVEDFLVGKSLKYDVLYEAARLIKAFIVREDSVEKASYKSSLAAGFLFQFLEPLMRSCRELFGVESNGYSEPHSTLDCVTHHFDQYKVNEESPILLPAKQTMESSGKFHPVGDSIVKTGAVLQTSGEAVYVDDIPSPQNCLYGAFIYSTMPRALIKEIKFKSDTYPDGVVAIISCKDIPSGGQNIGSKTIFNTEPLFAENVTNCAGDRIALVVAETQKQADLVANLVVVDYETDGLEPPILTLEEAVEKSSFFEIPAIVNPKQVGDFTKGMDDAEHKILSAEISLPSQYYFYMETQTALAVPDEDNCMVVYTSIQCPEYCHSVIATCLGVPEHNVRVLTRRVGGGFGGKAIRAMPVATVCALAANKLQRPVRIYVNRKTDMIMTGGRHPMKVTYSVGFKSNGKITGLHLDVLINAGMVEDISPIMPMNIVSALKKYDWGALSFDMKVCKTNHTSKSAMRGPGEVQGSFIAEAVIEHVAASLSMEVDAVRAINLHSFMSLRFFYENSAGEPHEYTLPGIWEKLGESARFSEREELTKDFNSTNLWRKRGISRLPIVHQVMVRPTPGRVSILWDGSVVVEVGGIELGQGLWTKVKQMTAFSLGLIQCEGVEEILDKVRVVQSDTLSLVQGGFTSGSTTSESSCEAVRICCDMLVERLKPLKENLMKQSGSVDWKRLILQAEFQSVNLSASSYYVPEATSMQYLNYGAAISEVEVNLLTGETTILRSDIIYDCGQSLNPAVDLGQIEGAFVQGIGFFMMEEYLTDSNGMMVNDSTWTYKIPTLDTIPKQLNVEILNSGHHQKRVLSSKASGEPPLLLAASVHCATRAAVREAKRQLRSWGGMKGSDSDSIFQLKVPATMAVVKELCGLDIVEKYLEYKMACGNQENRE